MQRPLVAFDFADRCIPNSVHGVHLLYKHECLPLVQLLVCRLKNYKDALFVFDSGFLAALLRTILWTVLNMVLQLVIAFVLASLLNIQDFKGSESTRHCL